MVVFTTAVLAVVSWHTFVIHITTQRYASALFCTAPLYFGEIGRSRTNRTFTRSFGDYCSTIKLYSHIGRDTKGRTWIHRVKADCIAVMLCPYDNPTILLRGAVGSVSSIFYYNILLSVKFSLTYISTIAIN